MHMLFVKLIQKYYGLQQVAESLVIYDQDTSLMRWNYAKQTLITEILRGRRYHNDVTLVLFEYEHRNELSQEEINRFQQKGCRGPVGWHPHEPGYRIHQ